jgi:hypothetical protein
MDSSYRPTADTGVPVVERHLQTDNRRPDVMAWPSATNPNRKFRQGEMNISCAALLARGEGSIYHILQLSAYVRHVDFTQSAKRSLTCRIIAFLCGRFIIVKQPAVKSCTGR